MAPVNFYLDDKLRIYLFYPEKTSLYQFLHCPTECFSPTLDQLMSKESLDVRVKIKYQISYELSRILLTLQNLSVVR